MRDGAFVIFNSIYFTQYAAILRNPTASTVHNHTKSGAVVFDSFPELCTKWIRICCWSAKSPLPCPVVGLTPLHRYCLLGLIVFCGLWKPLRVFCYQHLALIDMEYTIVA